MFTLIFWKGALERSVKTGAQSLAAVLTADATGILDIDWTNALSVTALAFVASVVTSVANPSFVSGDTTTGDGTDIETDTEGEDTGLDGVVEPEDHEDGADLVTVEATEIEDDEPGKHAAV